MRTQLERAGARSDRALRELRRQNDDLARTAPGRFCQRTTLWTLIYLPFALAGLYQPWLLLLWIAVGTLADEWRVVRRRRREAQTERPSS